MKNELYNDNFQNYKRYNIPKAQLVIADIPYNIGTDFYGSNPTWYINGDRRNGESKKAGKAAFNTDFSFNIAEYFHFCNKLLKKEPKKAIARGRSSDAPCMIVFCAFEQMQTVMGILCINAALNAWAVSVVRWQEEKDRFINSPCIRSTGRCMCTLLIG